MIVLAEPWHSVPPNWHLRLGFTTTVAELVAIASEGACAPNGASVRVGTAVVLAEPIGENPEDNCARARLEGVLRASLVAMADLGIFPKQIIGSKIAPYWRSPERFVGSARWEQLNSKFKNTGLPLSLTGDYAPGMGWLGKLYAPIPQRDPARLFVAPSCARLIAVLPSELQSGIPSSDAMRALCLAVSPMRQRAT